MLFVFHRWGNWSLGSQGYTAWNRKKADFNPNFVILKPGLELLIAIQILLVHSLWGANTQVDNIMHNTNLILKLLITIT